MHFQGSRARALYKSGLRTPQAIAEASIPEIFKALFESSSWTDNGKIIMSWSFIFLCWSMIIYLVPFNYVVVRQAILRYFPFYIFIFMRWSVKTYSLCQSLLNLKCKRSAAWSLTIPVKCPINFAACGLPPNYKIFVKIAPKVFMLAISPSS